MKIWSGFVVGSIIGCEQICFWRGREGRGQGWGEGSGRKGGARAGLGRGKCTGWKGERWEDGKRVREEGGAEVERGERGEGEGECNGSL